VTGESTDLSGELRFLSVPYQAAASHLNPDTPIILHTADTHSFLCILYGRSDPNCTSTITHIEEDLGSPVIIKPCQNGCAIGWEMWFSSGDLL